MGACTTIAIPWASALWMPMSNAFDRIWQNDYMGDPPNRNVYMELSGFAHLRRLSTPDPRGDWFFAKRPIQSWSALERKPSARNELIIEDARGWPFLAWRCTFEGHTQKPGTQWRHPLWNEIDLHGGIRIRPTFDNIGDFEAIYGSRAIPIRPIVFGLLGDVIIWSIVWTILSYLPFSYVVLRHRRRRKKTLCVRCAYDIRGHNHVRCPECGLLLTPSNLKWQGLPRWFRPSIMGIAISIALFLPAFARWQWRRPWGLME